MPGADTQILRTLETFGFEWDGVVARQSERMELYSAALARLREAGATFECSCSRRDVAGANVESTVYPGTCRNGPTRPGPTATRLRVPDETVVFTDRVQGEQSFALAACGDVVVRRRDGVFAYHLAVVVDDAAQGVTSVVRGADLLASTPWHLLLQRKLGLPVPQYAHLPLVTEPDGRKLAKSRRSVPLDPRRAPQLLGLALELLRHPPAASLAAADIGELWEWAIAHWRIERLAGVREARLPPGRI